MMINHMASPARKLDQAPEERAEIERMIEERYHITPDMLKELEAAYPNIAEAAFETTPESGEEEKRNLRLLNMIKDTLELNEKIMPYEVPKIPRGMPMRVAMILFPDFDFAGEKKKRKFAPLEKDDEDYYAFVDQIEREAAGEAPPPPSARKQKRTVDIVREVKGDLEKALERLAEREDDEEEEILDEGIEYPEEELPPTKREGGKKAS